MSVPDAPLPQLRIADAGQAVPRAAGPEGCWAWAHGQAAADNTVDPNAVGAALNGAPQLSLSRLVCPRLLAPNTDYMACVVPTFELGRKAGLGQAITDTELTAVNALAPAWTLTATAPTQVTAARLLLVAVPHRRRRRLRVAGPPPEDQRPRRAGPAAVAIGQPGFNVPGLVRRRQWRSKARCCRSTAARAPVVWSDAAARHFELALADIVNQPGLNQVTSPICGSAARAAAVRPLARGARDRDARRRELAGRAEPRSALALGGGVRHRGHPGASGSVDGVGVGAGRRDPAGEPAPAPAAAQHGRGREPARAASLPAQRRDDAALRVAGVRPHPVPTPEPRSGRTHADGDRWRARRCPIPATRTAMRRIGRQRGPLTRRIAAKGAGRSVDATWVARLNLGHRSGGSGTAHDRAGGSPAAADGGRGRRRDLELGTSGSPPRTSRCRHCRPPILCRRAGTIRGTSARRPPIISRASGSRPDRVVHPAHSR